jgi:hypothetical protein
MMFWGLVKLGFKAMFGMVLLMLCFFCTMSLLSLWAVQSLSSSYDNADIGDVAKLLYRDNIDQLRQTQGYHGQYPGYSGYDYTTNCGDTLYSPLPGRGVVTYNGLDGTEDNNTMLRIIGDAGEIVLLHGSYTEVEVGNIVLGGTTVIGQNASIGNSTGCHSHIVWHPNEEYNGRMLKRGSMVVHTGKRGNYGSVLTNYRNVQLTISHYDPREGGINCDSDCTTMASGDKVSNWILGQSGVYAAACPQEWPLGTEFQVDGQLYECRDRGGWINCYGPGDFDPAYTSAYGYSVYAERSYCWVDLMADSGHPYGYQTPNWSFIE